MLKKTWWLVALVWMMVFFAAYAEGEEPVILDPAAVSNVARPTDEPILSGSLTPMVGEEYTYTLVNAGKASNVVIKIFPSTLISGGRYQYYPSRYTSRTLSGSGTFKYNFPELRPYIIEVTYKKDGQNKTIKLFIKSENRNAALGEKINQIVQACRLSGAVSQYDIALWLHDYLINTAYYDTTYTEYGPDGVLLKGYGVCDSYSRAYQMLLDAFGIPNHRQDGTGNGGAHAWNVVMLDGKWYNVDVTWDDPVDGAVAVSGSERHDYFAIPDSILGVDHTYDITYPCTATDGSYYVRRGLPERAATYVEQNIIFSNQIGQKTITVAAESYCTRYVEDENGYYTVSSTLQNEIVFPLMQKYLSEQWWSGSDGQTIYQYSFVYSASSGQFIGTLTGTSAYTAECRWDSFPLIPNQMAVRYKFNKPVNPTQGLWLWLRVSVSGVASQSVRVTSQEGTAIVKWNGTEPFDVSVVLGSKELAKLHAIPFSPDDGQLFLPKGLQEIGREAFRGTAERFVSIPDGCTAIRELAFADTNLTCVAIPSSVQQIAKNAFKNCPAENLWVIVEKGSKADTWAKNQRFHRMTFDGKVLD